MSRCPQCQHENPQGARFCNGCGARAELACAQCGQVNPSGSRFCNGCGAKLGDPAPSGPEARFTSPESYNPRHLAETILTSKAALEGERKHGHRALRRPQGLDGAACRPRPRGGAQDPRSRPRAHDGGRPPLRGHGEPGDGRRDHGALRRAARPRGSRGARVLRRAPDAGVAEALRGRHAPLARGGGADPGRPQLGGGRRPLGRQRSPHGLHGRGPDHSPRGPDGAAGAARDRPADRRDRAARRGLRRGEVARADPREGPPGPDRDLRADGGGYGADAAAGRGAPRPHALRRPRRRGRAPAPGPRPGRRRAAARWSPSSARPGWASRGSPTSSPTPIGCRTG